MQLALSAIGLVLALLLLFFWRCLNKDRKAKKQRVEAILADRERLSPESFYERFFKGETVPAETVAKVRAIFEEEICAGIDLSRLAADDDFLSTDLKLLWELDSLASVEVICRIEKEFGIEISRQEAAQMNTFNQVVEIVWRKVQQQNLV
ncbi:MAG: hypothetical protein HYR56_25820 [Acidobacteria bacterium]|nr:hypothetical protein [Acidobacteriota bacterium]MBI3421375.1 hypothetical protein [Acidobacteriota bacterium]